MEAIGLARYECGVLTARGLGAMEGPQQIKGQWPGRESGGGGKSTTLDSLKMVQKQCMIVDLL